MHIWPLKHADTPLLFVSNSPQWWSRFLSWCELGGGSWGWSLGTSRLILPPLVTVAQTEPQIDTWGWGKRKPSWVNGKKLFHWLTLTSDFLARHHLGKWLVEKNKKGWVDWGCCSLLLRGLPVKWIVEPLLMIKPAESRTFSLCCISIYSWEFDFHYVSIELTNQTLVPIESLQNWKSKNKNSSIHHIHHT